MMSNLLPTVPPFDPRPRAVMARGLSRITALRQDVQLSARRLNGEAISWAKDCLRTDLDELRRYRANVARAAAATAAMGA